MRIRKIKLKTIVQNESIKKIIFDIQNLIKIISIIISKDLEKILGHFNVFVLILS